MLVALLLFTDIHRIIVLISLTDRIMTLVDDWFVKLSKCYTLASKGSEIRSGVRGNRDGTSVTVHLDEEML